MVLKCPNCKKEFSSEYAFCSYCGNSLVKQERDLQKTQEEKNDFIEFSNDSTDRDFLLTNISDIKNLHYIYRNFEENIACLEKKKEMLKNQTKGEYDELKEPFRPHEPEKEKTYTAKSIIIIDVILLAVFFWFFPLGIAAAIIFTAYIKSAIKKENSNYEVALQKYNEELKIYNERKSIISKKSSDTKNFAIPRINKAINNLNIQKREAASLLDKCYELNIIPSKYRNIYAITFIFDYMSTSKGSLRDSLFACDLDTIQSQLEKVIQNQATMICKLAKIEANSDKQLQNQQKMINHLENIEKNTYDSARASEKCAQYGKIIAHNTQVMAYCSAMTYIDSHKLNSFDPYSPSSLKDFGLEKFSSYYKF